MGSNGKYEVRRFPQVEAKIREWLRERYATSDLTGPMRVTNHEAAQGTGCFTGTVSSAMLALSRDGTEGLTRVVPGTYRYDPVPIAKVKAPAGNHAPRKLDMTVRPKLIQYARDVWARERKPTIIIAKLVAEELGLNVGSVQGGMNVLARDYPEVGYRKLPSRGAYEIIRPRRPQDAEPPHVQEPEPVRPEADISLTVREQAQVAAAQAEVTPSPVAQAILGIDRELASRSTVLPVLEAGPVSVPQVAVPQVAVPDFQFGTVSNAGPPAELVLWELKATLDDGQALLRKDDGSYWLAKRLS